MFFAADMPYLPGTEIRMFAGQFLSSRKPYGCMEFGPKHICTNPGAFRLPQGERIAAPQTPVLHSVERSPMQRGA